MQSYACSTPHRSSDIGIYDTIYPYLGSSRKVARTGDHIRDAMWCSPSSEINWCDNGSESSRKQVPYETAVNNANTDCL